MKILFFGTSAAVPAPGDGYTCFIVSLGGKLVLVDTGDNPVRSLLEAEIDPLMLDTVLLTHAHVDHLGSFPSLVSALDCMGRVKELLVVADTPVAGKARRLLEVFDIEPEKLTFPLRYSDGWDGGTGPSTADQDFSVSLLAGSHSVPTSMGLFREGSEVLLYTSDIRHGLDTRSFCGECTALIHEATYPHEALPDPTGHSSALQAGQAARASGAGRLFLCHIYRASYRSGSTPADEAGGVYDGEIIEPKPLKWYTVRNAECNH